MKTRALTCFVLAAAGAAGCVHSSDLEIRNPILARAVDPNRIVKEHGYAEQARGLPPGAMADEAILLRADPQEVCFAVTLHEFDSIDLREVEATVSAPSKDEVGLAKMWPEPPAVQTYDGLIPEQRETGVETVCSSRSADGVCQAWQTRPTYATVYVRGPVNVHRTGGKMCFENRFVTPSTEQLSLELRVPRRTDYANTGLGLWGGGGGDKKIVFRWGFSGATKH